VREKLPSWQTNNFFDLNFFFVDWVRGNFLIFLTEFLGQKKWEILGVAGIFGLFFNNLEKVKKNQENSGNSRKILEFYFFSLKISFNFFKFFLLIFLFLLILCVKSDFLWLSDSPWEWMSWSSHWVEKMYWSWEECFFFGPSGQVFWSSWFFNFLTVLGLPIQNYRNLVDLGWF
jgi:hypothetical protein